MDYSVYKLLHVFGIALLLVAIGGIGVHAFNGSDKKSNAARRLILSMHGIGTLLILVAGFGMLAKLGDQVSGFPGWLWPKLLVWILLAAAIGLPYRSKNMARAIIVGAPILVLLAAYFAVYKPF